MNEKKIIEIQINLADGITEIAELQKRITELTAANKVNDKSTNDLKNAYAENTVKIKDYRSQLNLLIKESANQARTDLVKIGHIQRLEAEVSNLTLQYKRLSQEELSGTAGKQVLENLKTKREELSKLNEAYGNYSLGVGQYARATNNLSIQLGMVMKELPNFAISARTGIMSLTNNIPMLAEAFKAVKLQQAEMIEQGKKATSMFSLITKSIFGVTGIASIAMVLLQLFNKQIVDWVKGLFKGKEATDSFSMAVEKMNKTLSDGNNFYTEAVSEIEKMSTMLHLASMGLLDADLVLKEYNSTLSDTYGSADSLSQALENIKTIKVDYINGLVAMTAAQDLLTNAINKSSEALSMEKKGKPGFFQYAGQMGKILYDSFDISKWGLYSLPNTLNRIANLGNETYATYFGKINKLRDESAKGVDDYFNEIKKIAEQYKNDPFILKLLGLSPDDTTPLNYKDTPEWKAFSDAYDERRRLMQIELDIEKSQREVSADLQKSFDETKTEKAEKEALKRQQIIIKISKATQQALKRVLDEELRDADKSVRAQIQLYEKKLMAELSNADTALATAEAKRSATLQLQMDLLAEQERVDVYAARKRGENVQLIEEYYAAKRVELQQKVAEANLNSIASLFGSMASILKENTKGQKIAASAQALINTYLGATSAFAQTPGGIITKSLAATAAVAAGMASIYKIWAVKEDVPENSAARNTKTTVTEKFHTGTYRPATPTEEQEITRTLLTTERVLSPSQTAIFDNIISRVQSYGGSQAITNGVGVSDTLAEQRMEMAFTRALRNMPNPVMSWTEYTNQAQRQKLLDRNTKFG